MQNFQNQIFQIQKMKKQIVEKFKKKLIEKGFKFENLGFEI